MTACRDVLDNLKHIPREIGTHAGLLLSRYLRVPVPAKDSQGRSGSDGESDHPKDRHNLYQAAIKAVQKALPVYRPAYQRRLQDLQAMPSLNKGLFTVQGRLIVGLGGESILETGITLHHTYGVPVIPGSALKGLASHFCHQVWGVADAKFQEQGEYHRTLFSVQEDAGYIIFHEAWIEPDCLSQDRLVLDVMTPHHSDYYKETDNKSAPTDFDSPNPVTFLSVTSRFHVAVSCNAQDDEGKKWAELALKLLTVALENWGIGGKTNTGYGRLSRDIPMNIVAVSQSFKVGDKVKVQRVEDPKSKGRVWFRAEDGLEGRIIQGSEPQIKIGESTALWIATVNRQPPGYNFSSEPLKPHESKKQSKKHR